jgi:anhydro-N-acetylmuramic acid kinase
VRKGKMRLRDLDLIGLHGQTITHLPVPRRFLGRPIRATLQIGDPSVLANLTGVTTVGDFRVADMAVGGQGAPLVPYFDWLLFRHRSRNRILLNIGGIANMTILPAGCPPEKVIAFDTGPGNMVVDALMRKFYRRAFDRDGQVAFRGAVQLTLLRRLLTHPFFRKRPPKSTGREEFGDIFIREMFGHFRTSQREDAVATASFLTPLSVHDAYRRFVGRRMPVDELIVSGGGARNLYFLRVLEYLFGSGVVNTSDEFGISSSAKEAICFAVLANETIAGNRANLPSVTGARRAVILGKVCQGDNKPASG